MKAKEIVSAVAGWSKVDTLPERTCDIYISGGPDSEVTGVVTTFMATVDVIRKAIALGCNMIITHEPTYFNGWDETDWLEGDPVYLEKKRLIDENNIVIWRCHDRMHMMASDGIYAGLLKELAWEKYARGSHKSDTPAPIADFQSAFHDYYDIPETTLRSLASYFKSRLGMDVVRVIGDPDMACSRVGILVGGGSLGLGVEEMPMQVMRAKSIDVMVCGEVTEWTLCAYANDAHMLGMKKALLIIGHERSEEWGMKYMAECLQPLLPSLPVAFVDAKEPFVYL
jgi:putative NIF3 family GTP cyclohydrolase 1 type 2